MILGIDPGYDITGFAILKPGKQNNLIDCGVIRTEKALDFFDRLVILRRELLSIIKEHAITDCSIEEIYFSINKKTALKVAAARGVIAEAIRARGIVIEEYSPNQIKKAITGNGQAGKKEVQMMVQKLLGLKQAIKQDDACDAAAIAICHTQSNPLIKRLS